MLNRYQNEILGPKEILINNEKSAVTVTEKINVVRNVSDRGLTLLEDLTL